MSGVTGREAAIAIAKTGANSWGVAASVTIGGYFQSDGGMTLQPAYVDDNAFGQDFLGQAEVGDIASPDLTWAGRSRYDDRAQLLLRALAMGSPSAATLVTSAVGQVTSYRHVLDLAPSIDGLAFTAAVDKVLYVDELTSAKCYGFSETGGDGGVMDLSFKVMGSRTKNDSTTNTRSTVNAATYPQLRNRVFRKHGAFRLNLQSGGSLVAGDAHKVETCGFEFTRPQDAPFVYGQDYVDEPADNGHPEFMLRVSWPRMHTLSANSMYSTLANGTILKGDLTFLGANINSTDRYTELYQWPHLELQEWSAPLEGATQVKPTGMFRAKLAASAPTGMTGVTNPFRLTITNANSIAAFL